MLYLPQRNCVMMKTYLTGQLLHDCERHLGHVRLSTDKTHLNRSITRTH